MADNAGNQMQGGSQNNLQPLQMSIDRLLMYQQHRQALEQFMTQLGNRNPNHPNQQQQIDFLRSNPHLMSSSIEHMQTNREQYQWIFRVPHELIICRQQRLFSQSLSGDNCIRQKGISLMNQNQDQIADCPCQKKPRIDVNT